MIRVAVAVLCLLAARAAAEPSDEAFSAASRLAGDPATIRQAIAAFEALGEARPPTRWTDNAWSEAARLAERLGELERARRAYDQVAATTDDAALRRRARAALDRLGGERWDAVRRDHARWVAESGRGDPRTALGELEQLARANPAYPQRGNLWLAIARGWEIEGEADHALEVLRQPLTTLEGRERARVGFAFVRIALRRGAVLDAETVLDDLARAPDADRVAIAALREHVDTAERRAWVRRALWLVLAALAILAAFVLRRETGSWRGAGRGLVRPPSEVLFLLPVAGVLVAIAQTGNPVVARALWIITLAGVIVAWLSGVVFEAHRARTGRVGAARAIVQAAIVIGTIGSVAYLAIDRDRLLDLVEETVEHGPTQR